MLDMGARLDIKNRLGLTPLTLAASLTRKTVCYVMYYLPILKYLGTMLS